MTYRHISTSGSWNRLIVRPLLALYVCEWTSFIKVIHHPHNMCGASAQDVRGIRTSCAKRSIPFIRFFQNMEWNTNALNCKAHGGSTRTELNMMSRRSRRYKERKRCSVQLPDNFWDKYFEKKVSNITGKQPPLLHAQQCLRAYLRCVLRILRILHFSVWHFVKVLNLASTLITPNFWWINY